jgi:23S rRNA pseudouridine1911/1915/1917 synthase
LDKLFDIIHEDADLLVINKPAGLVCHPTKNGEWSSLIGRVRLHLLQRGSRGDGENADETLSPQLGSRAGSLDGLSSGHLVNRLDRETSGVVIAAKNSVTAGELGKIWETRAVEKEYVAIVHGHVHPDSGTIDAPLGKDERSKVVVKDCVRPDGRPAQTEFFVEQRFARASVLSPEPRAFSRLRLLPRTGLKHQIRIHLAQLGHPIVGDKIYGGDEDCYLALVEDRLTDAQRQKLIFTCQALHARALRFIWRGQPVEFLCAPEKWFADFLPPADYQAFNHERTASTP